MPSLDDLRTLGYTVGVAHGEVAREESALAEARARATPERIQLDVQTLVDRAVSDAITMGLPAGDVELIASRVFAQTLREVSKARDADVVFHERAVEIATAMPTVFVVDGFGARAYVECTDDSGATACHPAAQELIDAFADPAAHAERRFQHEQPEAAAARAELREKGYDVVRPDPVKDVFDVKDSAGSVVAAAKTPPDLPPLAETLPPVEP